MQSSDKLCGMCGGNETCKWKLTRSGQTTKAKSEECTALYGYSYKSAIKFTTASPCTNVPVRCKHCDDTYVFRYALRSHYNTIHRGQQLPDEIVSTELDAVLKKCEQLARPHR